VKYQLRKIEVVSTRRRCEIAKNSILTTLRPRPKIQGIPTENSQSRIKKEI